MPSQWEEVRWNQFDVGLSPLLVLFSQTSHVCQEFVHSQYDDGVLRSDVGMVPL